MSSGLMHLISKQTKETHSCCNEGGPQVPPLGPMRDQSWLWA